MVAAVLKLREMAVAAKAKLNKPRNPAQVSAENSYDAAAAGVGAAAPAAMDSSNDNNQNAESSLPAPADEQANQQNDEVVVPSTGESVDHSTASATLESSEQLPPPSEPTFSEQETGEDGKIEQEEAMHEVFYNPQKISFVKEVIILDCKCVQDDARMWRRRFLGACRYPQRIVYTVDKPSIMSVCMYVFIQVV